MTTGQSGQAYRYIRTIQRALGRLEALLREMEAQAPEPQPQDARGELLGQVHLAGAMEQRRLFQLLDQRGITHAWIGAQVAAEYLDLWHAADGRTFYRVTERAIRELHLGQLTPAATHSSSSDPSLDGEGQSKEDSACDQL